MLLLARARRRPGLGRRARSSRRAGRRSTTRPTRTPAASPPSSPTTSSRTRARRSTRPSGSAAYAELQGLLEENVPYWPLWYDSAVSAISSRVTDEAGIDRPVARALRVGRRALVGASAEPLRRAPGASVPGIDTIGRLDMMRGLAGLRGRRAPARTSRRAPAGGRSRSPPPRRRRASDRRYLSDEPRDSTQSHARRGDRSSSPRSLMAGTATAQDEVPQGGTIVVGEWQAATQLNPFLTNALTDPRASRPVTRGLANDQQRRRVRARAR